MNTLYRKLRRNFWDNGLRITLSKVLYGVFATIYLKKIYRLYRINLEDYTPKKLRDNPFTFVYLDREHIDWDIIKQIEEIEEWLSGKIGPDLQGDGRCLVALDGERVAGFNWVNFKHFEIPIVEKSMTFRPDKAWSQQITVHRYYREKGLGSTLRHMIFAELKSSGIKKFYGGTLPENSPNIGLSGKVGFEIFVDIHFMKLIGSKHWAYKRIK